MPSIFSRRRVAPATSIRAHKLRQYVAEDFLRCCAYCLLHERLAGGEDNFELDHFRPRSREEFAALIQDFFNLYYSCHVCNHYKASTWPAEELMAQGYRFVDPCKDDFTTHFSAEPDGTWRPLTPAGEYSAARLRLNRSHLVEIRALLADLLVLLELPSMDWNSPPDKQLALLSRLPQP
jgi:hypothetical protein